MQHFISKGKSPNWEFLLNPKGINVHNQGSTEEMQKQFSGE